MPESNPNEKPSDSPETEVDQTTVLHIQMLTSLIEGRAVSLKEVIGLINKILRQHSIDNREKDYYAGAYHHKSPP
jgi:hypothetical protein